MTRPDPDLRSNEEAIEVILEATENAGLKPDSDIYIALDVAASELFKDGKYNLHSENKNLDSAFLESLKKDMPDLVYVYSENSAKSFLNLIKKYELVDYWMNTNLMCIGEKTSSVLNEIKWKKIFLFNPGEEEFLLYKI